MATEKSSFSQIYFRDSQQKESDTISSNVSAPPASRIFSPEKPVLSSSTPQALRNRYNPRSQSKPPTFSVFDDARTSSLDTLGGLRSPSLTTTNSINGQSQLKSDLWSRARTQDQNGHSFSSPTPIYGLPINETPYRPSSTTSTGTFYQQPSQTPKPAAHIGVPTNTPVTAVMDRMRESNHLVSYLDQQQQLQPLQMPSHRRRFDDPYMPTGLTSSDTDALLLNWVLVVGLNTSTGNSTGHCGGVMSTLLKLQEFGEIVDHIVAQGNWMFVKFESLSHAERAIHQHVLPLTSQYVISLLPVTPANAINFGLDMNYILTSSGSTVTSGSSRRGEYATLLEESLTTTTITTTTDQPSSSSSSSTLSRMGEVGASYRSINDPHGGLDEYLRPPKKTSNVCSKIIEFFFSY